MRLMPRCMAMDAYDVSRLPSEQLALLVTSTTGQKSTKAVHVCLFAGQGDVPDNMRSFWRFLLRKSLPPDSLSGLRCAVFGLGDSGYAKYNVGLLKASNFHALCPQMKVAAKKLLRRLEGLGAKLLLPLGLGDDQHANGYEAGLDPWLAALWPLARRAAGCLPEGVPLPVMTAASQLQLGQPRFHITLLPPATAPAAAAPNSSLTWPNDTPPAASASRSRAEDRVAGKEQEQADREGISLPANGAPLVGYETQPATASQSEAGRAVQASQERPGWVHAARAGRALHSLTRIAATGPLDSSPDAGVQGPPLGPSPSEDWPGRALLLRSQRVTAASHFQDTRLLELQLEEGVTYEPGKPMAAQRGGGDVLAVLPRPPGSAVDALLERLQLDGEQVVRVQPGEGGALWQAEQQAGNTRGGVRVEGSPAVQARVRDLVQVLHHFASEEREKERLAYFGSPEGREDLYRYNQREGRTLLEVLMDFPSARLPLAWLLEAATPLRPRYFSIASSIRCCGVEGELAPGSLIRIGAHPQEAHLLVALVEWRTPCQRLRRGLCSSYLAAAQPVSQGSGPQLAWRQPGAAAAEPNSASSEVPSLDCSNQDAASRLVCCEAGWHWSLSEGEEVACWVQRGAFRMPADRRLPLLLIGPGTGVAPFRAFLEERQVWQQQQQLQQQEQQALQQQQDPQDASAPGLANIFPPTSAPTAQPGRGSTLRSASFATPQPPAPGLAAPGSPAPCHLFFGCRSASSDFYFQHQWQQLQQQGVLAPAPLGLVTAFSQDQGKKVYVSHKLMEHGADVWGLLEQGALVYVAGSAKNMPQGVLGALEGIAQQHGGLSLEAATQFMKQLELKGRYLLHGAPDARCTIDLLSLPSLMQECVTGQYGQLALCAQKAVRVLCSVRGMPGPSDIAEDSEKLNTVEIQVPHPVATVAAGTGWESTFDQLDERQHISFSDLQLHELLAQGRHREVYRGYWFNTEVAVICMKGGGKIREARLLQRQCKHPNLQMFYGWSQDDNGSEYIVMELAAHGSLDVLLQQQGHTLRTADKMVLCEQVCAAMRALAVEGVKHGNLAASSVLVHSTQPWIVKVAGFELAEPVDLDRSDSGQTAVLCSISSPTVGGAECGSRACEAEKGDVKAFGLTMWQIMSNGAQVQAVGGQELPRPASCPAALYQLMQHCWAPAPADRPTFSQLSRQLQRWRTEYSKQVLSKHGLSRRNAPPSCTSVGTSVILSLSFPLQGSSLLPFPSGTLDQTASLAEPDPDGSPHPIALLDIGQSLPCGRGGPEPGKQLQQLTTEAQPIKLRLQHGIQQLQHHKRHSLLNHQQLAAHPVVQDDYDSGKGSACLEELPQAEHPWLPRHQVYEPPPSLAQSTASLLEYSRQSAGDEVIPEYEGVEPPGCSHHGPAQSAPRSPCLSAGGSCAGCLDDANVVLKRPTLRTGVECSYPSHFHAIKPASSSHVVAAWARHQGLEALCPLL
ncbi:hypothetical protein QJQ45_024263 [Haematococcus lacustris]|nr:hypothetical protein QJQ45_024263 [Haematococcus lacustris]